MEKSVNPWPKRILTMVFVVVVIFAAWKTGRMTWNTSLDLAYVQEGTMLYPTDVIPLTDTECAGAALQGYTVYDYDGSRLAELETEVVNAQMDLPAPEEVPGLETSDFSHWTVVQGGYAFDGRAIRLSSQATKAN